MHESKHVAKPLGSCQASRASGWFEPTRGMQVQVWTGVDLIDRAIGQQRALSHEPFTQVQAQQCDWPGGRSSPAGCLQVALCGKTPGPYKKKGSNERVEIDRCSCVKIRNKIVSPYQI